MNTTDPLHEKYKNEAAKLDRRRKAASDTSKEIVVRREAFFDRLALLDAGALTFSVTLLGSLGVKSLHDVWFLYCAWILLLAGLGASLTRNLTHQHHQMADAIARMAELEIAVIDADYEIVSSRDVRYSDSAEPFDRQKEMSINRTNRQVWEKSLGREQKKEQRYWKIVTGSEVTAVVSTFLGFIFLAIFAVFNLRVR